MTNHGKGEAAVTQVYGAAGEDGRLLAWPLLAAAVGAYLPELAPDFVQARRLELLDAGGGVFR